MRRPAIIETTNRVKDDEEKLARAEAKEAILAVAGAKNLLLVTFLLPISALLLGGSFLGETITPQAIAGMALIGVGLAAIDGRLWRMVQVSTRRRTLDDFTI